MLQCPIFRINALVNLPHLAYHNRRLESYIFRVQCACRLLCYSLANDIGKVCRACGMKDGQPITGMTGAQLAQVILTRLANE